MTSTRTHSMSIKHFLTTQIWPAKIEHNGEDMTIKSIEPESRIKGIPGPDKYKVKLKASDIVMRDVEPDTLVYY